jgi:hypothetical protein
MQSIIRYLNEMKQKKIILDYSIGGATALIYYFEPIQTQDIDVFIFLENQDNLITTLSPAYDFLSSKGGVVKDEYIIIHNTPVQLLPAYNTLIEEAIRENVTVTYLNERVQIFSLEHLMAIMVQTARGKDKARLEEILNTELTYDKNRFLNILERYDLKQKWIKIQEGFES